MRMIGGMARRLSSPLMVGRDAELHQLQAAAERGAAGETQVVVVGGEAGVGKSRLIEEFARDVDGQGPGWPSAVARRSTRRCRTRQSSRLSTR